MTPPPRSRRSPDTLGEGDDLWLYTGRHAALAAACQWMRASSGPATLVVTGEPGTGKSALLARLSVLADPDRRARVPHLHTLPADNLPPDRAIARFVHARGRTPQLLMSALCEATHATDTDSPGALLAELRSRGGDPVFVVIDAVDEALTDPTRHDAGRHPAVEQVLEPLIHAAAHTPLRLLIGTRRHLLPQLGDPDNRHDLAELLDLDRDEYADTASVRAYIEACLIGLSDRSPYRHQPRRYLDAVCDALAAAAGRSFLVAHITARSHALSSDLANPDDPAWRRQLPRHAGDAMREDLRRRLGADADRARDLLLPLAYAHGSGLPWEDIWPALARTLTHRPCRNADLEWLIEHAGHYITEATAEDGRRSVYRLCHASLAEYLRNTREDNTADEATITHALIAHTGRLAGGRPDWPTAHPYTRAHLATHAANGNAIDPLAADPRFLLAAEPSALLAALAAARTHDAVAAADAYRHADARMRANPAEQRPAYLQLAARCAGAPRLAAAIADQHLSLSWSTPWACWLRQPLHVTITGYPGFENSVAFGQLDGRPVIISGGGAVRVWDAATGHPVDSPLTGHAEPVVAVAFGRLDGRAVIVSGSDDQTVRVWDATTGHPIGDPLTGHTDFVRAVVFGQVDGRAVIASGSDDETVRIWDVATGHPIGDPLAGHTDWVRAVAFGHLNDRAVIISGSDDDTVRVWDATTGHPIGNPLTGHADWVRAVAFGHLNDRAVIISGSDDQTVRIWDAATGHPIGDPLTGHTGSVRAVAFGQLDGRAVIISGSNDETVRIWDATTGHPIGVPLTGHNAWVHAVTVAQVDGRRVIISGSDDETVRVWDVTTGRPAGDPFTGHAGFVTAVAFGELDGQGVVVSGGGDDVRIWDVTAGRPIGNPFTGHTRFVSAVAFGQIDGQPVIISGGDERTVRIWDATTGHPIGDPLTGHTSSVNAVAFGQIDGQPVIISGSYDRTVRIWDATTGHPIGNPLTGHTCWIRAVTFGQLDGRSVIISGSIDATVRIWDAATGHPIGDPLTGHTNSVTAVAFGQLEGRAVIISGGDDQTVRIWDPATGHPIGDPLTGHTESVNAVAFGQIDGQPVIISGSSDRTVRIWDAVAACDPRRAGTSPAERLRVDLACGVLAVSVDGFSRVALGTELGVVLIRPYGR